MNNLIPMPCERPEPHARRQKAGGARIPAIVLGGSANALSVVRSLGRAGVPVSVINQADSAARRSRYARWIPLSEDGQVEEVWANFLLGPESDHLAGAVLFPCCDPALEILARHRAELAEKFTLDDANPQARIAMLNKISTYQIAAAAGIATPRFWQLTAGQDLHALEAELSFPLIVKPSHTHLFRERYGKKFVTVHDFAALNEAYQLVRELGIDVMLVEFIPGLDDQLCSYYTYLDHDAEPCFHFTKRVIRRYPLVIGNGCYHITDWNPEVASAGLAFLRAAGVRGLGNVEFKRDPRDGALKLIECNARLTEANCLVAAAGLDLPLFVYNRLTGGDPVTLAPYRQGLRLWYPFADFRAFRQLHREGQISWATWLKSIVHPQTFPFFRWSDPWPSVIRAWSNLQDSVKRRLQKKTSA
ncbi:MAG: carboxylate--amine ligase [Planctomycetes bacterium]|nr:carboxylate--amine ligase [Planctomycetota bacterium]